MTGEPVDLLAVVVAKQEIHAALTRYCRGIDRRDVALVLSAFHPDAVDNHTGPVEPVAERFARVLSAPTAVKGTSHNLTNVSIEVDGDVAHSESYLLAYHRVEEAGAELDWLLGARYVDRFERRAGRWLIAHRTVVFDFDRFDPVPPRPAGNAQAHYFDDAEHGSQSTADFSYRYFAAQYFSAQPTDGSTG